MNSQTYFLTPFPCRMILYVGNDMNMLNIFLAHLQAKRNELTSIAAFCEFLKVRMRWLYYDPCF